MLCCCKFFCESFTSTQYLAFCAFFLKDVITKSGSLYFPAYALFVFDLILHLVFHMTLIKLPELCSFFNIKQFFLTTLLVLKTHVVSGYNSVKALHPFVSKKLFFEEFLFYE